jgi:PAS domain S-box-containing protein
LIETSSSVSASLDLDTVLGMIAEQAKRLLAADGSRIHMIDPTDEVLRTLVAQDPHAEAMMSMKLNPADGLAGHVLQSGQAMIVNNPNTDPRGKHVPGTPEDEPECLALAPLNIRHRPMGVMAVRRFGRDRPFQPSDLRLLTAFASQAAIAIENADLYGQIERQAQQLEQEVIARTQDLAKSEARYRGLVETSLTGIIQIDRDGTISYANQVFAELIDYPQDQIQGMPVRDAAKIFLPEDSRDLVLSRFEARIIGQRPASEVYEVEFMRQSGRRIPTIFAVNRITDDDGTIQGITCLVLDISARKSLETALRSERDRLEAILTNIGDAVVVTDPTGNIEYVNPAWERLNGYSRSEALGMNMRQLSGEDDTSEDHSEMLDRIEAGRSWSGELVSVRKDGTKFDASVTGTPIRGDDGEVVNFVTVQHDISALKEVDRLKSQFVSDVSHELRTPLTNIRLYVDLLAEKSMTGRAEEYLVTLNRESERLAHLIDDLLSLSRLEAGSAPFEPRPIDINELLDHLSEDRRALAAEQKIELKVEAQPDLAPVMGDARLISQIFTNLLTNAMNYTLEGGQISLRTHEKERDGRKWLVAEVEDTGLGIDPEEKPKIFQRFFRGKASQKTGAPGTGLGLAICREIAELHGGYINLKSEFGEGTLVSVWLPLDSPPPNAPS